MISTQPHGRRAGEATSGVMSQPAPSRELRPAETGGVLGLVAIRSLPDSAIVARCRSGENGAWCALVERYSHYVYAIATQVFRLTSVDAEDIFQEVFARTYENLDRLRNDAAIRPWIGQLTRRLCIDQLRSRAAEDLLVNPDLLPDDADDSISRLDEAMAVRQILETLPDQSREILDRFFIRDESYRTISAAMNIPPGTIASRISRALTSIRKDLEGTANGIWEQV